MTTSLNYQQILLLGTCRILVEKNHRSFNIENNFYIQQPVHYSTNFTEVINNFDIISKKKSMAEYSNELLFEIFRYTFGGKAYEKNDTIDLDNSIAVMEICSEKYTMTTDNDIVIPYKNNNDNIKVKNGLENAEEKINEMMTNYKFKKIIIIPPITNSPFVDEKLKKIRTKLLLGVLEKVKKYDNIILFDWNKLFNKESFIDAYHFTDQFKEILLHNLNKFINENM